MKAALYKALNIEQNEGFIVLLLVLQSFFLGIFYGSFDIAASALFLEAFPADMLPKAFVISGIAGIILTGAYSKLQAVISFSKLALINLISITIITFLLWTGYFYTSSKWLPFLILVMMGPLNIIAILGFWGVAGRMFSLRQGKRLFGLIDSGQVFGVIVSSYAIPLILLLNFSTKNLLIICSASVLFALLMQLITSKKFPITEAPKELSDSKAGSQGFFTLFKNRFVIYMSVFVSLSMVTAFFIYYSFLSVTNTKYPDATELAKFLGVFTGTLMIFSFIFKTFFYSKIMQTYNLRTSLLILPFLLVILSVLAIAAGGFLGYSAEDSGFILFFMLITLSRLFSRSLKESIEAPSLKILYLSLDKKIRYDAQAKIDGIVNELAALLSGVILAVLGMLSFIQPIHYTVILVFLLLIWIYVTFKLYSEYKIALVKSLEHSAIAENSSSNDNFTESNDSYTSQVIYNQYLTELQSPLLFEAKLPDLLFNENIHVRIYAYEKIASLVKIELLSVVENIEEKDELCSKVLFQTITKLKDIKSTKLSREYFSEQLKSKYPEKRLQAVKLLEQSKEEEYISFLIPLLRDIDPSVRIAAIKLCADIKLQESVPLLIDYLSEPEYRNYAAESLIKIGDEALDVVELSFYKSGLNTKILSKYIYVIRSIGGEKAVNFLINKLNFPNRQVVIMCIDALSEMNYSYKESYYIYLRQAIDTTISIIAWNMFAQESVKDPEALPYLSEAIDSEIKDNFDILYTLLSLIYDPKMIMTVKDNIENGSSEGTGYAMELMDLYISEELKHVLFPLFENTNQQDKLKRFQDFFAYEVTDLKSLLYSITRRDANLINRWTKACAIYNLANFKEKAQNDLLAHLYNKDKLLFETSGYVIHKIDPEAYNSCGKRINSKLRNELDYALILSTEKKTHLLIERIIYLKSIPEFKKVHNTILAEFADCLTEIFVKRNTILLTKESENDKAFYIILQGSVKPMNLKTTKELKQDQIICDLMFLPEDKNNSGFITSANTHVYAMKKTDFRELISSYPEIADAVRLILNNSRA